MDNFSDWLFPASSVGRVLRITITFGCIITLAEIAGKVLKWDVVSVIAWAFCGVTIMAMLVAYGPLRYIVPIGAQRYPPAWGNAACLFVGMSLVIYLQLLLLNAGESAKLNAAQTFLSGVLAPLLLVGIFWLWNQAYQLLSHIKQ